MYRYLSIGIGGIGLFLWYRVVVSVSVISSRYLPIPLKATQMVKKYLLFCIYVPLYPFKLTKMFLLKKLQFHNLLYMSTFLVLTYEDGVIYFFMYTGIPF